MSYETWSPRARRSEIWRRLAKQTVGRISHQKCSIGRNLGSSEASLVDEGLFLDQVLLGTDPEPLDLVEQGCALHSTQAAGRLGLVAPMCAQSENNLLALPRDLFPPIPVPA